MTTLRCESRSADESLAFFREHRSALSCITHVITTIPQSRADRFYAVVMRDEHGGQMQMSGLIGSNEEHGRSVIMQIVVEAGFAEEAAAAIRTHAAVRMHRSCDGATVLEHATGPRSQFPRRLLARPAATALRAYARRNGVRHDDLADVLGVDAELVASALGSRWLSWDAADRVAISLRMHPGDLWPDWYGGRGAEPRKELTELAADTRHGATQ